MTSKISNLHLMRRISSLSNKTLKRSLCTATTPQSRTQNLERIANEFLDLNKLERHDYLILLRHKLGLVKYGSAISGMDSSPGGGSAVAEEAAKVEKTAFDVRLDKFEAAAKIKIIKEVRTFTDLGLKEAKDLVEKAPVVLKKGVTKEEATAIVDKLKELGAIAVLE